jgi:hypothetical protein
MEMEPEKAWRLTAVVAIVLFAVAVTSVPVAAAQETAASASAAGARSATAKKLKILKKQTALLVDRVSALEAALAKQRPSAPPVPTTLPPSGPAGGDLSGTYPNPQIRPNSILSSDILDGSIGSIDVAGGAIGSNQIADQSILSGDIANEGIFGVDLASGSVGSRQLGQARVVFSDPAPVGPNSFRRNVVSCPSGTQLIGGGGEWSLPERPVASDVANLKLLVSAPVPAAFPGAEVTTWEVAGLNTNPSNGFTLFARALCLN